MEYRKIDDYDNYVIYEDGKVKNTNTNKFLNPTIRKDGYLIIGLVKDGKQKIFLIHRLVAIAFIENPNDYKFVDHIDNNRTNNNVSNLRWCTSSENNKNRKN